MTRKIADGYKRPTRQVNFFSDEQLVRMMELFFGRGRVSQGFMLCAQGVLRLFNPVLRRITDVFNGHELKLIISLCEGGFPSPNLLGNSIIHSLDMMFQVKNKGLTVDKNTLLNKLRKLHEEELWLLEMWACRFHMQRDISIDRYVSQLVTTHMPKQDSLLSIET
jgi:hypothetical protein